jgi:RNA recognition motif-containing protein
VTSSRESQSHIFKYPDQNSHSQILPTLEKIDERLDLRIFVGGIPHDTKIKDLKDHFHQFGPIFSVEIPHYRKKSKIKGFGFVTFIYPDSVLKACLVKQQVLKGKAISIKRCEEPEIAA